MLKREPSQRTKAWVKWNSRKTSAPPTPTEIVHLGGSRVETAPEEVSPISDETDTSQERSAKTWQVSPHTAPEPPIWDTRVQPEPQGFRSPIATPSSTDTTFSRLNASPPPNAVVDKSAWPLRSASLKNFSSKHRYAPSFSSTSSSPTTEPTKQLQRSQSAANADRHAAQSASKTLPPWLMEALAETDSDAPESTDVKHADQPVDNNPRITQWFTFPEPANPSPTKPTSIVQTSPKEPLKPAEYKPAVTKPTSIVQTSPKESLKPAEYKPTATKPAELPEPARPAYTVEPAEPTKPVYTAQRAHTAQSARTIQSANTAQPVHTAKTIHMAKPVHLAKTVRTTEAAHSIEPKGTTTRSTLSRHSRQERLWLHQNYRGEATFLKAWGLNIEYQEDRDEGIILMQELMESENVASPTERHKAKAVVLPDGGMKIIIEDQGASFSETDRLATKAGVQAPGEIDGRVQVPRRGFNGPHQRTETEYSVLGAYLNARMSRID